MPNETHDPTLTSWVDSANGHPDFPIQNLPFGVIRRQGSDQAYRGAVAIGDLVLDLKALQDSGVVSGSAADALAACTGSALNPFMALGADAWSALRLALSRLLRTGAPHRERLAACLLPAAEAEPGLPCTIGDYTDFYASIEHATNIGRLFRPDNPLLPNYHWVPIAYHGRASSVGISGQSFPRPAGQIKPPDAAAPELGPCRRLDYEMELGVFIGPGNPPGQPVEIDDAPDQVFGFCLLNDWSARDIQAWEYQPLGPFLGKNFATTLSPWVVTAEALEPFRQAWSRDPARPQPLPYLSSAGNDAAGALDIHLAVSLTTARMRRQGDLPAELSLSSFRESYWTVAQMVTHHTVNGCDLRPGDLLGSGTVSGRDPGSLGSLMEITRGGQQPLTLPNGEQRTFLEDGDTVIMRGWCERSGASRIGFGSVSGTVLPARLA